MYILEKNLFRSLKAISSFSSHSAPCFFDIIKLSVQNCPDKRENTSFLYHSIFLSFYCDFCSLERVYEDHELLVENLLLWTRDSKNKLLFVERPDRTQLFLSPERYLLGQSDRNTGEYDDHSRNILLEEFFSSSNVGVPEVITVKTVSYVLRENYSGYMPKRILTNELATAGAYQMFGVHILGVQFNKKCKWICLVF